MIKADETTIVFGYSDDMNKYSNKAFRKLVEHGHKTIPFNTRSDLTCNLPTNFHTLTLYINAELSNKYLSEILQLKFKRIIFNPGTENQLLEKNCLDKNIEVVHGCTLVMLSTDQF